MGSKKFFVRLFSKRRRGGGCGSLLVLRRARNSFNGVYFLLVFLSLFERCHELKSSCFNQKSERLLPKKKRQMTKAYFTTVVRAFDSRGYRFIQGRVRHIDIFKIRKGAESAPLLFCDLRYYKIIALINDVHIGIRLEIRIIKR